MVPEIEVLHTGPALDMDGAIYCHHSFGGGMVARTAHVDLTAYVGPRAWVHDTVRVTDQARIEDRSEVGGTSVVRGNAKVCGNSQVRDTHLEGAVEIHDLRLDGPCNISGDIIYQPLGGFTRKKKN